MPLMFLQQQIQKANILCLYPLAVGKHPYRLKESFLGKMYKFDLHPDNANAFAGVDGAVRNFTWKISGAKPEGGYYGSPVAAYSDVLSFINLQDVELTLAPDGPLANGTAGSVITKRLVDIGGGEYGIDDVPIGKYTITARNVVTNQNLQIRLRNTGDYANSVNGIFNSESLPDNLYHIVTEIK
jgi:hypothetical protein